MEDWDTIPYEPFERMSDHPSFHSWSPLCLLLKETDSYHKGVEDVQSSSKLFQQQQVSKHTKRWSTGPSFVKHCELLKRHSLPAVRPSDDSSQCFLQKCQLHDTFSQTATSEQLEKTTRSLSEFMESASEDGDSLFDNESPTLLAKTQQQLQQEWVCSLQPLYKAQSPPSDITQSVVSNNTQSPVPSLLSETELPDFGEDFVNVEEEMWSADDWKYFKVAEWVLQSWRYCLLKHNERFSYQLPSDDEGCKLVDIRQFID
ncbi:hypothetical protein GpartN1_g320.t1 [Galdieria partita]|uniref:Uncharacterized protein n=1 Tax=Galdieria partita TaxID=83374 RepID=A0A9C7UMD8_9RHOD|nr:hypothetical protein GpartN1_g320.t1 [Galdieria partita]